MGPSSKLSVVSNQRLVELGFLSERAEAGGYVTLRYSPRFGKWRRLEEAMKRNYGRLM